MNEEESKAIYRLNFHIKGAGIGSRMIIVNKADVETVLNMIEEKDKEINHWKNKFEREFEDNEGNILELLEQDRQLRKKDKIIDLMAEKLTNFTATCIDTDGTVTLADKEDVKEYFERKVENGN